MHNFTEVFFIIAPIVVDLQENYKDYKVKGYGNYWRYMRAGADR